MYNKRRPGVRYKRMRSRRRSNRGFSARKNPKPSYIPVIMILCLSIGCGYVTAKYVVEPVVNYVPQLTAEKEQDKTTEAESDKQTSGEKQTKKNTVVEDDVKVEDAGEVAGYAVQFGCYSGRAAAEKVMAGLNITGLQVLEQNKMFKIVGQVYDSKAKAKVALEELPDTVNAFVTTIYK